MDGVVLARRSSLNPCVPLLGMNTRAYAILSGLCICGAVTLAILDKDAAQVAALLGLAGTLAGRGKSSE